MNSRIVALGQRRNPASFAPEHGDAVADQEHPERQHG